MTEIAHAPSDATVGGRILVGRVVERFPGFWLTPHLLALAEIGSRSHGTYIPNHIDDIDLMGIVAPPRNLVLGLHKWEHWVSKWDEIDVVLYSLDKMVRLLVKSNPNVLGYLWLPHYIAGSDVLDQLRANRDAFASKQAYKTFCGYAVSQLKKMKANVYNGYMGQKRKELVDRFGYDTKNAAHLVRILRMGIEFLGDGVMRVRRDDAEELRAIKRGDWSYERVLATANELFAQAEEARDASPLPVAPDLERIDALLVELQLGRLGESYDCAADCVCKE